MCWMGDYASVLQVACPHTKYWYCKDKYIKIFPVSSRIKQPFQKTVFAPPPPSTLMRTSSSCKICHRGIGGYFENFWKIQHTVYYSTPLCLFCLTYLEKKIWCPPMIEKNPTISPTKKLYHPILVPPKTKTTVNNHTGVHKCTQY